MVDRIQGDGPVLLSQPHAGTALPAALRERLNGRGRALADTDWHVDQLYDGLLDDATVVRATLHRYVVDVNRPPDDHALYPGRRTTGLCPVTDFDGQPIYQSGREPTPEEIDSRRRIHHAAYHQALSEELERIRARHGFVILYDCHSIRSRIPYLFEGTLPVFNIGTNDGASCAPSLQDLAEKVCRGIGDFSVVVNGRFKGGWTTRRYGAPDDGVHAIQMELAQRAYMEEAPPWTYDPDKAEPVRTVLKTLLEALRETALSGDLQ